MALTKAQVKEILSKAGVSVENTDAAVEAIMNGHLASVNALREERDEFKANAEKLPDLQKELDKAKQTIAENEEAEGKDKWKVKYDAIKEEYDNYKSGVDAEKSKQKKSDAYRDLLKEAGVFEKRIPAVLRVTDLDKLELDDEGKLKDVESLKNTIKEEWSEFIMTGNEQGANTGKKPPVDDNDGGNKPSMAKQAASKYYNMLYGTKAEESK